MKKLFSIMLITVIVITACSVPLNVSAAVTKAGMSFRILKDGKAEVIRYNGSQGKKPVIPRTVGGRKVVSIGEFAFSGNRCKIKAVKIPDTVKKIKQCAFSKNSLTSVKIPASVEEIHFRAFDDTKLESVVIPSTVIKLGKRVFADCKRLKKAVIKDGINKIPEGLFQSCGKLKKIKIPASVTEIGAQAFQDCGFKKFVIPKSITAIKRDAFSTVTEKPRLEKFEVAKDNPSFSVEDGILYNKDKTELIVYPSNRGGGPNRSNSFEKMPKLSKKQKASRAFTIPERVNKIADYAFSKTNLQKATIPGNITTVSTGAFGNCSDLDTVIMKRGVKTIKTEAFCECSSLKKLVLSPTIETIEKDAFSHTGLKSVSIPDGVESIEEKAFLGCELSEVLIPSGVKYIGNNAFGYTVGAYGIVGEKYEDFIIKGKSETEAESYAKSNGFKFVEATELNPFINASSPLWWIVIMISALVIGVAAVVLNYKFRKRKDRLKEV